MQRFCRGSIRRVSPLLRGSTFGLHNSSVLLQPSIAGGYFNARSITASATESSAAGGAVPPPGPASFSAEQPGYDPWQVLGLKPGASQHDIRVRYHDLTKQYHPEYNADGGDLTKFNEVDKAYQLITRSPTLDKRYRNLVSDTQYVYYKYLPQWISKNLDEMPRYWSWARWRLPPRSFWGFLAVFCFCLGRFAPYYPKLTLLVLVAFAFDCVLHTMSAPIVFVLLFYKAIVANPGYTLAWFHSPKGMLRRALDY